MILEARIGFIIVFLLVWSIIGLIPWTVAAIASRGRGSLLLLPIVILTAIVAGTVVPITGAKGLTGFWISLITALIGAIIAATAGAALVRRLHASQPISSKPAVRPEHRADPPPNDELSPKP
ncbi:MAG: hypothetical protein IH957_09490 [Chloroflexi bacterium]|nr:hypothetical protein [Chloroflexota bacterium]